MENTGIDFVYFAEICSINFNIPLRQLWTLLFVNKSIHDKIVNKLKFLRDKYNKLVKILALPLENYLANRTIKYTGNIISYARLDEYEINPELGIRIIPFARENQYSAMTNIKLITRFTDDIFVMLTVCQSPMFMGFYSADKFKTLKSEKNTWEYSPSEDSNLPGNFIIDLTLPFNCNPILFNIPETISGTYLLICRKCDVVIESTGPKYYIRFAYITKLLSRIITMFKTVNNDAQDWDNFAIRTPLCNNKLCPPIVFEDKNGVR